MQNIFITLVILGFSVSVFSQDTFCNIFDLYEENPFENSTQLSYSRGEQSIVLNQNLVLAQFEFVNETTLINTILNGQKVEINIYNDLDKDFLPTYADNLAKRYHMPDKDKAMLNHKLSKSFTGHHINGYLSESNKVTSLLECTIEK